MLLAAAAICVAVPRPAESDVGEPPRLYARKPTLPVFAASAAGFAAPGWRVERELKGDLNRDGRPDLIAILKGNDPTCVVPTDRPLSQMDTNPRILLVAFGVVAGFRLYLANASVIPRIDDPYMDDPFNIDAFTIRGDVLHLGLTSWRSMGGWTTFTSTLSFRWDGRHLRLIGFDRATLQRNSGKAETLSVNFLTGRAKVVTGSIEDDIDDVTTWQRVQVQGAPTLERIGDGLAFEPRLTGKLR